MDDRHVLRPSDGGARREAGPPAGDRRGSDPHARELADDLRGDVRGGLGGDLTVRDLAGDMAARDLTVRELAHRWWRPATVVLVLAAAVVWRLVAPGLGAPPNLEIATAATFLAVLLLRNRWAAVVPFAVVAVSDAVLGNTQIMWFTWSAWAVVGVGAILARHLRGPGRYAAALGVGVVGSLWFFAWTNFGVWLLDGMYPSTLDGLLASYVAGLPFLRTMLLGNLVLVPLAALVADLVERAEASASPALAPAKG